MAGVAPTNRPFGNAEASRTRPRDETLAELQLRQRREAAERANSAQPEVCPTSWVVGPAPGPRIAKRQREAAIAEQDKALEQYTLDAETVGAATAEAETSRAKAKVLQVKAEVSKAQLVRTVSDTQRATDMWVDVATNAVKISHARHVQAMESANACCKAFEADKIALAEAESARDEMVRMRGTSLQHP